MLLFMPASIAGEQIILIDTSTEASSGLRVVTYGELLENVANLVDYSQLWEPGDRVGMLLPTMLNVSRQFLALLCPATVVSMNPVAPKKQRTSCRTAE